MNHAVLLISCPDQKGITASVTDFVFRRGGNIVHADQHTDADAGIFFMRMEWEMAGFAVPREKITEEFCAVSQAFNMTWSLYFLDEKPKVAIFVSRQLHCLHDLLFRYKSGQLPCSIDLIVSNHRDAEPLALQAGIEFCYMPVTPQTKQEQEAHQHALLKAKGIEVLVLARYHQILTPEFVRQYENRIINIHHSFLPAFVGGNPYAQAYRKGVKIIGATSHYVIEELDGGPIIEQDTVRIDHRHSIQDLVEAGQDLERMVLYRALRWHLERKVLSYGNKTVVFD
ncbi:MAG: formyltetrahydrofolate deformylase [Candidatus Omnitrophica bacterium]|nr:formyltetrahydrofolate deformylase [Candidatus Omnitrophota bacterium]